MHRTLPTPAVSGPGLEVELLALWQAEGRLARQDAGGEPVWLLKAPVLASEPPGTQHLPGLVLRDLYQRYFALAGRPAFSREGWDSHGLAVELQAEARLGLDRHGLEDYGLARFAAVCHGTALQHRGQWLQLAQRLGLQPSRLAEYSTAGTGYIDALWGLVRRIHDQGLLYRDWRIQWYSPAGGTVLSTHEAGLNLREVVDTGAYVRFPVAGEPDTYCLAWLPQPWMLPAGVALAVHAEADYVEARRKEAGRRTEFLIVARAHLDLLGGEVSVVKSFSGRDLSAKVCLDPLNGVRRRILAGAPTHADPGSGIGVITPAFHPDDFHTARRFDLPVELPLGPDGRFGRDQPLVGGRWFRDAGKPIIDELRSRGLLFRQQPQRHRQPYDWHYGSPLLCYPVQSWFIRIDAVRGRLLSLAEAVDWRPPEQGRRFLEWLEKAPDWAVSRQRFWGTPLPIWQSDAPDSGYTEVLGSLAELQARGGHGQPGEDFDPHRPGIDRITWAAPDGGVMRRTPEVLDAWFDAGAVPVVFPTDGHERLVVEGPEQVRGWCYTLHVLAALSGNAQPAFRRAVVNGVLLDGQGKRLKRAPEPAAPATPSPRMLLERHGADPLRWWLLGRLAPGERGRLDEPGIHRSRRFFATLHNVQAFWAGAGREADPAPPPAGRPELDRWVLSRLHGTIAAVGQALDRYEPTRGVQALEQFVEALSNWYLRRSRHRLRRQDESVDRRCARHTLGECLEAAARLLAPFAPFHADWLYRAVAGRAAGGVHSAAFPAPRAALLDPVLEARMQMARRVVAAVLLLRNRVGINVRQPLARLRVAGLPNEDDGPAAEPSRAALARMRDLVLAEVNVLDLEYLEDGGAVLRHQARPDFRRLGRRLGPRMPQVKKAVERLSEMALRRYLATGRLALKLPDEVVELQAGDLQITVVSGGDWQVIQEAGLIVALDTSLDPELLAQGQARETVNRIQRLRKTLGLDFDTAIRVRYRASASLAGAIHRQCRTIAEAVQAVELQSCEHPYGECLRHFTIGAETLVLAVERL